MKFSAALKTIFTYVACLMLALAAPVTAFAEELAPTTEPTTEPQVEPTVTPTPSTSTEPTEPVAPAPAAPVAPSEPAPAEPQAPEPAAPTPPKTTYTFDAETQKWNSNTWQWDAAAKKYVRVVQVVEPQAVEPGAATSSTPSGTSLSSSTKASIANALDSIGTSGNASVRGNTTGGSATSGDALASATIINKVDSTMSNSNNTEAATFVMDVMGDVNGDIMLEPMLLKAMLEARVSEGGDTQMNSSNDTSIQNDINLTATSGSATVSSNTGAGDATTGSANTMANVMNLVNSMIAANQSFDGTINIYGNLNGDILIAPDFLAQMLASNGIQASATGATQLNARDTQEIVNNVSLAAESGAALVAGNTRAGDATSGAADTNLVIFNMTGHEIVAANSLLVFINVLGSWVGVIVDAPQGATAAAIGDGVTKNDIQPSLVVDATNNTRITNNINLGSYSGDASVVGNTSAGDATSGDATASANIANISNSSMGLTGWFGRLFINVFGTWNGSFGVNTSAGDPIQNSDSGNGDGSPQVIRFVPRDDNANRAAVKRIRIVTPVQTQPATNESSDVKQASVTEPAVLAATDSDGTKSDIPTQQSYIDARKEANIPMLAASVVLIIASGYVLRRFLF
ncbi:MAG: hypothetical protein V4678_03850 [Patescibacteria group bacterium]